MGISRNSLSRRRWRLSFWSLSRQHGSPAGLPHRPAWNLCNTPGGGVQSAQGSNSSGFWLQASDAPPGPAGKGLGLCRVCDLCVPATESLPGALPTLSSQGSNFISTDKCLHPSRPKNRGEMKNRSDSLEGLKSFLQSPPNISNPEIHLQETVHLIILIYSLFWKFLFGEKSHLQTIFVCK